MDEAAVDDEGSLMNEMIALRKERAEGHAPSIAFPRLVGLRRAPSRSPRSRLRYLRLPLCCGACAYHSAAVVNRAAGPISSCIGARRSSSRQEAEAHGPDALPVQP